MCLGIPMQIISVNGVAAIASDGRDEHCIDLSLVGNVPKDTWVLTFLGAAREIIDADEAEKIKAALDGLQSLLNGGDLGDAFADLEAKEPELPPHLRAAFDAGEKTA